MNEIEIVKALRCCGNTDTKNPDCEHCPLKSTHMCVKVMLEGSADLIESQSATIERLQGELDALLALVPHKCETCIHCNFNPKYTLKTDMPVSCAGCCPTNDKWEWREGTGEEKDIIITGLKEALKDANNRNAYVLSMEGQGFNW